VTAIAWDQTGEHVFHTGIDRGVLYLNNGKAVAWNGLVSVSDGSDKEVQSYYIDGVKYLTKITPGDYSGKLRAFTYPIEFDQVNGVEPVAPGLNYYDQQPQDFSLSYRTRVGNDLDGVDHGYKIHILYNLVADPDETTYETLGDAVKPVDFSWSLTGTPPPLPGYRPTVHISIDSTLFDESSLKAVEDILYGTDTTSPRLPSIEEITEYVQMLGILVIVDNGDGSWTAIDEGNNYVTMLDPTTFKIDGADATYLDVTTYQISTTNPD
jgi:hypothetical protein